MNDGTENRFEVEGLEFTQQPLKFKQQNAVLKLLMRSILPTWLAQRNGDWHALVADAVKTTDHFEELVAIFAGASKVKWGDRWVNLTDFLDVVFSRHLSVCLAWLLDCICWQYEDFLAGTGQKLIEAKVNRLTSLLGLTGQSGESSPTPESPTA